MFGFIEFVRSTVAVSEDAALVVVNVYRHGGRQGSVSATFATKDISAVAGLDYMYATFAKP